MVLTPLAKVISLEKARDHDPRNFLLENQKPIRIFHPYTANQAFLCSAFSQRVWWHFQRKNWVTSLWRCVISRLWKTRKCNPRWRIKVNEMYEVCDVPWPHDNNKIIHSVDTMINYDKGLFSSLERSRETMPEITFSTIPLFSSFKNALLSLFYLWGI